MIIKNKNHHKYEKINTNLYKYAIKKNTEKIPYHKPKYTITFDHCLVLEYFDLINVLFLRKK